MPFLKLENSSLYARVDEDDFLLVSESKWRLSLSGYVRTGRSTSLHRVLMGVSNDRSFEVDHINGDKLDNRKINLRLCSRSQNEFNKGKRKDNTSGFKGVFKRSHVKINKFCSVIGIENRKIHLGYFGTPEEAARAYDKAARELHGEFARLNFPDEAA